MKSENLFMDFKYQFLETLKSDSALFNGSAANLERSADFEDYPFDPFWKMFFCSDMYGHKQILYLCFEKMSGNNLICYLKQTESALIKTIKSLGYNKDEVTYCFLQLLNKR